MWTRWIGWDMCFCNATNDLIQTSRMNTNVRICQFGCTLLLLAAEKGHFPVIGYLLEKGAEMEAKDEVSDVISSMWSHTYVTHEYTYVNVSEWIHSIDARCKGRSFANGWIFAGERSWYGGKELCKWCRIIHVKPHIRHTCIYVCECIRMETLHWYML